MAALVGRASKDALFKANSTLSKQQIRSLSVSGFKNISKGKKIALVTLGALTTGGVGYVVALNRAVHASELLLHPPKYPWPHAGMFKSFDHDSMRRGYEVYKQVCAACHSLNYICYRNFVGEIFNEAEAKAEAKGAMITDGPNEDGEMYQRAGKLSDALPAPYANDEEARAANNGALPPDLSYITKAREGGENYLFALLTGYHDAPAGVSVSEDQHYNPYFPGGAISMAQALYNEIIEYEDGTPATQSQLAKDVTTFLCWCSEPEHDKRKMMALKAMFLFGSLSAVLYYYKRLKWSYLKTRHFQFKEQKGIKKML